MRLPRPYIPRAVRVEVAERQYKQTRNCLPHPNLYYSDGQWLKLLLREMFGDQPVELHHDPALVNRIRLPDGRYEPGANDPDWLVYLPKAAHDIRTRVRGERGQHSDLGLVRKRKRIERKAKRKFKHRWPKRKLQSRGFR